MPKRGGLSGIASPISRSNEVNVEIDELTPCLVDTDTGEVLATEARRLPKKSLSKYNVKNGWGVDWAKRPKGEYVMGVFLEGSDEPQGLISLRKDAQGLYMSFMSTAPQNNKMLTGGSQKYEGVGGHLFAIAIHESLKAGHPDGCVYGYAANDALFKHYIKRFGAIPLRIMHPFHFMIEGRAAKEIIDTYNFGGKQQ